MLTEFTDAIYRELLSRIPGGRPVSRSRLHAPDFPGPIAHFLEHALDRRLELESQRTMEIASEWVDHGLDEVKLARSTYLRVLARFAHFPAGDWPRALRQAVQLTVAYLVRPVPTLTHFVFGEQESRLPATDVLRRAGYFMGYGHLASAVEQIVGRQRDDTIDRRSLSEALERVDRKISSDYDLDEWSKTLSQLFQLGHVPAGSSGVPLEVLVTLFEHKQAHALAARIRQYARGAGQSVLFEHDLPGALEEVPEPAAPEPIAAVAAPALAPRAASQDAAARLPLPDADQPQGDLNEPLWKKFQSGTPAAPQAEPQRESPASDTPLWRRFQGGQPQAPPRAAPVSLHQQRDHSPAPSSAPVPVPVLASAPTAWIELTGRRAYFVRGLFHGNDRAFDDVVEKLESASDWSDASRILSEDVFRPFQVDIYSDAAIGFTNAVERRFPRP